MRATRKRTVDDPPLAYSGNASQTHTHGFADLHKTYKKTCHPEGWEQRVDNVETWAEWQEERAGAGGTESGWHAFLYGSTNYPEYFIPANCGKPYNVNTRTREFMPKGTNEWNRRTEGSRRGVNWKMLKTEFHIKLHSQKNPTVSKLTQWKRKLFSVLQTIHSLKELDLIIVLKATVNKHKQMGRLYSKRLSPTPGSRLDLVHGLSLIKTWSS